MADSVGSTLKQEALENLKQVAFAKMTDFIDILPGGEIRIKDLSQIPPEQMVGIRELEFDEADPTRIRKISLHDSFWALHLLALHTEEQETKDPLFNAIATFRDLGFEVRQIEEGFELVNSSLEEPSSDDFGVLVDLGLISRQEQERYNQPVECGSTTIALHGGVNSSAEDLQEGVQGLQNPKTKIIRDFLPHTVLSVTAPSITMPTALETSKHINLSELENTCERSTVAPISVSIPLDTLNRIKDEVLKGLECKVPYTDDSAEMATRVIFVYHSQLANVLKLIEAIEQPEWSRAYEPG